MSATNNVTHKKQLNIVMKRWTEFSFLESVKTKKRQTTTEKSKPRVFEFTQIDDNLF